jgi:hypothetical protein
MFVILAKTNPIIVITFYLFYYYVFICMNTFDNRILHQIIDDETIQNLIKEQTPM